MALSNLGSFAVTSDGEVQNGFSRLNWEPGKEFLYESDKALNHWTT